MTDGIHGQANDLVEEFDLHAEMAQDFQWIIESCRHLMAEHDLSDLERVKVVSACLEATVQKSYYIFRSAE